MPKRVLRVGELGIGLRPTKLHELASKPRHAKTEFVGVEEREAPARRLSQPNLSLHYKTDAVAFLRSKPADHFSHLYCHFLLQHLSFNARYQLLSQVMRTLQPGARIAIVDEGQYYAQLKLELAEHGFEVRVKRMTVDEVKRLGTEYAKKNAAHLEGVMRVAANLPEQLSKEEQKRFGVKTRSELIALDEAQTKHTIGAKHYAMPGNDSMEARRAIDRIVNGFRSASPFRTKKPFLVFYAKKPVKK